MWLRRVTHFLLRHRWQALILTFASTFVPIIGILGILIAALVTLVKGVLEGAVFTLAATLPYIISFYISSHHEAAIPLVVWAAVGVAVISNVLTWVFTAMLRWQASFSQIIQIAALVGILVISIIHLAYPQVADWWGVQLQDNYNQAASVAGMLKNTSMAASSNEAQIEAISLTKSYATGLMIGAILLNAILQLIVARWWQAAIYNPGSLRKELQGIRLSRLAGLLFLISMVFSYLGNSVVLDIMPVLYMLFCAAGLSLIHYLIKQMNMTSAWFWLAVVYIVLIFAMPTSVVIVAVIAFFDIWFDLRKRFKKG